MSQPPPTVDPSKIATASSDASLDTSTLPPFDDSSLGRLKEIRERLFSLRKAKASTTPEAHLALINHAIRASPASPAPLKKKLGIDAGSKEANSLWREVSAMIRALSKLRAEMVGDQAEAVEDLVFPEADQVLEDIVPMFLEFWSSGAEKRPTQDLEMYPLYVKLAKLNHILDQLNSTGLYTIETLHTMESRLLEFTQNYQSIITSQNETATSDVPSTPTSTTARPSKGYAHGLSLVQSKLHACNRLLTDLRASLALISPALSPVHARLVSLRHELQLLLQRGSANAFSLAEVTVIQDELRAIDSARIDGAFFGKDGTVLPGQAAVIDLLEASYEDVHELLGMREAIGGESPLRDVYEVLIRCKGKLERMLLVGKWMGVKGESLVGIQMELGEVDNLRVDGKFLASDGTVPEGQAVMHFLLHKCYRLVHKLQERDEETVHPSLQHIRNGFLTLRQCLNELLRWKVKLSTSDLIVYQMKLARLDDERVDGRYLDEDGNVPEGQGILHSLLNECYELLRALQRDSQDEEEDDYEDDGDGEEEDDAYGEDESSGFEVHEFPVTE